MMLRFLRVVVVRLSILPSSPRDDDVGNERRRIEIPHRIAHAHEVRPGIVGPFRLAGRAMVVVFVLLLPSSSSSTTSQDRGRGRRRI